MPLDPTDIADITDVAALMDVTVMAMRTLLRDAATSPRMVGFPPPLRHVGQSPVWERATITEWMNS